MPGYLLIQSRDPFEGGSESFDELARSLAAAKGGPVTVFLVENGVLPARKSAASARLAELAKSGVEILVDEFALRERGISRDKLIPEVKPAAIDAAVDRMIEGRKTLWN